MDFLIKATDRIVPKKLHFLIYGDPGSGKTSLAFSSSKPLCFDFNKGGATRSSNRGDIIRITDWSEVVKNIEAFKTVAADYDTIIIDTVQDVIDMIIDYIKKNDYKAGKNNLQLYPKVKDRWKGFLSDFDVYNKTVIFIAHVRDEEDAESRIKRPYIVKSIREPLISDCDMIGLLTMTGNNERYFNCNPNEYNLGKNSANLKAQNVPDLATQPNFMARLIDKVKENIGNVSEEQAQKVKAIEVYKNRLVSCSSLTEFNEVVKDLKLQEDYIKKSLHSILKERSESFNAEYDNSLGLYKAIVKDTPPQKPSKNPQPNPQEERPDLESNNHISSKEKADLDELDKEFANAEETDGADLWGAN